MRSITTLWLSLALIGCGGKLLVKVDVADPARIGAVRASSSFRTQCFTLATQTDGQIRAEIDPVIDQLTKTLQIFHDARLRYADAAKLGDAAKRRITAMPHTREELDETFDVKTHMHDLFSARDAIARAANARGCETRDGPAEQLIAQREQAQRDFQTKLRAGLDDVRRATHAAMRSQPAETAAPSVVQAAQTVGDEQTKQAAAAAEGAIAQCRDVICGMGLGGSADAYAVASLPEDAWNAVFNRAFAQGINGNVDIVIKMNEQADFTVKGMRFDVSKIPEVARKAATQALLIATQIAGVPATAALSSGSTENKAVYAATQNYGATLQKQDKRDALVAARRDALAGLAITIAASQAQMQDASGRDQLKVAVSARLTGSDGLLRLSDYPTN